MGAGYSWHRENISEESRRAAFRTGAELDVALQIAFEFPGAGVAEVDGSFGAKTRNNES